MDTSRTSCPRWLAASANAMNRWLADASLPPKKTTDVEQAVSTRENASGEVQGPSAMPV